MFDKKFSESGLYLPFPGFTVVADAFSANAELFQHFHARLSECPAITTYHALLPAESYHITAFSIMQQKKINQKQWISWMRSHLKKFRQLHSDLEAKTSSYMFRITKAKKNRLTLEVEIDPAEAEAERGLASSDVETSSRIPYVHHISLGYCFKKFESKAAEKACWAEFHRIFREVFPTYESDQYLAMQPKLCYFDDMTKFIPWDATAIPPFTSLTAVAEGSLADGERQAEEDISEP